MKATDMIKSIAHSEINAGDIKVVTQYKNQNTDVFVVDNFGMYGHIESCRPSIKGLSILESQSYLATKHGLVSPDGTSVLTADHVIEFTGGDIIYLYKFY